MIIDAHTHFYPSEISKYPDIWANKHSEKYWATLVGKRPDGKLSLQGFPSEKKFLSDMDDAGVERAIIQGWYWENPDTCEEYNAKISDFVNRHSDRLSAFASVQPHFSEHAVRVAKHAKEQGFCGIGELHDGVQNFSYLDSDFEKLAICCAEENLPICVHLTERTPRQYLGKVDTNFDDAFACAKKFTSTNFIFAHWLGSEIFENPQNAKKLLQNKNVFFDSSASPLLCGEDAWQKACNFADYAIYGSDYPLRLYPRKFKVEEMKTIVDEAKKNIDKDCAENFFRNNILNIIK